MKRTLAVLCGLAAAPAIFAQPSPRFEVASIRPVEMQNNTVDVGLHIDGSQMRISALMLRDYIAMAYRVKTYQVSGPDFLTSQRFQINATIPAGVPATQIPEMMQALLAERFGLRFHRDKKEVAAYALSRGSRPLTLTEVKVDPAEANAAEANVAATGSGQGVSVNLGHGASYTFAAGKFEGKKLNMPTMVDALEIYMDLPIIDLTGLTGYYDVAFTLAEEDYRAMLLRAARANGIALPPQYLQMLASATTPTLFDAIENLGLKLESKKVPQDVIVVDEIAKTPTEN